MRRRSFVGASLAGFGLPASAPAAKAGDIPKRVFGKTGQNLTVVGQAGGRFELAGFEDAKAIVRRAFDLGVNYFDNARVYWDGRSEEVFGAVLPPFRKQVFITTKSLGRTRAAAEKDLEISLRTMRTDYLDLWQIHGVATMKEVDQIFSPGGAIEAFEAAKKAGKCRFIGFTGHADPHVHLEMLKRYKRFDTILMPMNIADPGYLSFEKLVLPEAVKQGLGIQCMKSTANAKLLSAFSVRECLRYALSLPVHCVPVGCTTIGQIEDDVRIAGAFLPLPPTEMEAMRRRAQGMAGPALEDWKKKPEQAGVRAMDEHV